MKFDLYILNKFGSKVYVTQFNPNEEQYNLYSTFNEKISLADNDQTTLTFSLMRKIPNEIGDLVVNPYLKYLKFGAKVYLETDRSVYELIITQVTPKTSRGNTTYDFTCQDEISYKWPRMQLGYSYSTMERGGVKTLYQIAQNVLSDCKLDKQWTTKSTNSHLYPNDSLLNEKITLEVEGSNPYNVIVEALNTLNASMLINYRNHEIRFYQKDKVKFSGYRYRPETSLRSLSATFDIDGLATILHVVGGTGERDVNITLVPAIPTAIQQYLVKTNYTLPTEGYAAILNDPRFEYIAPIGESNIEKEHRAKEEYEVQEFVTIADKIPSLGQFLYNFEFFLQNGSLTYEQYNELTNIFNKQMRDINLKLKPLIVVYHNQLWELQNKLVDIEVLLEQLNAAYMQLIKENRKTSTDSNVIAQFNEDVDNTFNKITNKFNTEFYQNYINLYGQYSYLENHSLTPELLDMKNKIINHITIRDESRYYYYLYQDLHKEKYNEYFDIKNSNISSTGDSYNYDQVNLQGDILYYYDRFYMALQMCGVVDSFDEFEKATSFDFLVNEYISASWYYNDIEYLSREHKDKPLSQIVPSTGKGKHNYCVPYYAILFGKIFLYFNDIPSSIDKGGRGIYEQVDNLEQQNRSLWEYLYSNYSSFIYEATYENADELDSVSLYNQAISYFENYHHPKSSYSVEILNLDELEQIGTPNLKVNSRIRIYNEDLGLDEGTSYIDGEDGVKLNNISYTTNELLITALNYDLRKSAAVSVTVERIIQHQTILQKLIKSIK